MPDNKAPHPDDRDPFMDSPEFSEATPQQYSKLAETAVTHLKFYGRKTVIEGVNDDGRVFDMGRRDFRGLTEYEDFDYAIVRYIAQEVNGEGLELKPEMVAFVFSQIIEPVGNERKIIRDRYIYLILVHLEDQSLLVVPQVMDEERFEGESTRLHSDKELYKGYDMSDLPATLARAQEIAEERRDFEEEVGLNDANVLTMTQVEQLRVIAERIG